MYYEGDAVDPEKKKLKEEGFPVYRQSNLKNYYTCPYMFKLCQTLDEDRVSELIESRNTKMGLLFEGYLLGFKEPESLIKGIGKDVKQRIKDAAEYVRNLPLKDIIQFGEDTTLGDLIKDSKTYYDQMVVGETLALTGEADMFHPDFGFFDIKHTEELSQSGWTGVMLKHERMQCIHYPYLKYLGTGEMHTFYYIAVETKYATPIVRIMPYKPTEEDFKWLENEIKMIHADPFYYANEGEYGENCLSQRYGRARGRCKFLEECEHGRKVLGGYHPIQFQDEVVQ